MDICKVKKLKIQQELLEKHITSMLNGVNLASDHDKLQITDQELKDQRMKTNFAIDCDVITDKDSVVEEIERSNTSKPVCQISVNCQDVVSNEVMPLEGTDVISNLEQLVEVEKTLTKKIEIVQGHIESYKLKIEKVPSLGLTSIKNKPNVHLDKTNANESKVEEFQNFLSSSGGHTGGWTDEDHQLFLKYRLKLKGVRMVDALHILLPDISPDAIGDHEEWYKQYEILKAQRKEAIKAWKESNRKESVIVDVPSNKEKIKDIKADPLVLKDIAEKKKQKIKEWKLKKQELKLIEDREKAKDLEKMSLEKKIRAQEQMQQKKIIEQYKKRKALTEEEKFMENSKKENKKDLVSNKKLLAMFQERDRSHTAKTLQRLENKKQSPMECTIHTVEAERDPKRLLNPTKAWMHHVEQQKEQDAKNAPVSVNYIQHLPHLKVPTWRKSL